MVMMQPFYHFIIFLIFTGIQISQQIQEPSSLVSASFSTAEKRQGALDFFKSLIRRFDYVLPDGDSTWEKSNNIPRNRHHNNELLRQGSHYLRNQPYRFINYRRPFRQEPPFRHQPNNLPPPYHQIFSNNNWLRQRPHHYGLQRPPYYSNYPNNSKQRPNFPQSNHQRPKTSTQPGKTLLSHPVETPLVNRPTTQLALTGDQKNHSKCQESEICYIGSHNEEEYNKPIAGEANNNQEDSYEEINHNERGYEENIENHQVAILANSHRQQSNQQEATHSLQDSPSYKPDGSDYHYNNGDNSAPPKHKYVVKVNLYLHKYRDRRNDISTTSAVKRW